MLFAQPLTFAVLVGGAAPIINDASDSDDERGESVVNIQHGASGKQEEEDEEQLDEDEYDGGEEELENEREYDQDAASLFNDEVTLHPLKTVSSLT